MTLLVTGASGQLGSYLLREARRQNKPLVAWSGSANHELFGTRLRPVDLTKTDEIVSAFRDANPLVVIHAAAMSRVDACLRDPQRAAQVNTQGTQLLAELSAGAGARLVYVSTDLVFDGQSGGYRETDSPSPLSIYGKTKAAAECAVQLDRRAVIVRVSLLFGPTIIGRPSFFDKQIAALRQRTTCSLFADEWRTPISLLTAARSLLVIANSDFQGLLHLGGPQRMSRLEMGWQLAEVLGCDASVFVPSSRASAPAAEPRPRDTSLDSSCWREHFANECWPNWRDALQQMGINVPV